jgi:hypothetical protein
MQGNLLGKFTCATVHPGSDGDRVEIVADRLPEELEQAVTARGVAVVRDAQRVRLMVDAAQKRELVEALWMAGCDVVAMNPVKTTLQDVFLKLVEDYEGAG